MNILVWVINFFDVLIFYGEYLVVVEKELVVNYFYVFFVVKEW